MINLRQFRRLQIALAIICIVIPLILRCCDKDDFQVEYLSLAKIDSIGCCKTKVTAAKFPPGQTSETSGITRLSICGSKDSLLRVIRIKKYWGGFRYSISDYARNRNSYLFGFFYCLAAMLYIYNGLLYDRQYKKLQMPVFAKHGRWYNVLIGLSLIAVVFYPDFGETDSVHIVVSVLFFAGNLLVLFFVKHSHEKKWQKYLRKAMAGVIVWVFVLQRFSLNITVLAVEWISLTLISIQLFIIAGITPEEMESKQPANEKNSVQAGFVPQIENLI